jgi:hypothetical protein
MTMRRLSFGGAGCLNLDATKSNHQDTKITKVDQGSAEPDGQTANLIADGL